MTGPQQESSSHSHTQINTGTEPLQESISRRLESVFRTSLYNYTKGSFSNDH